MTLVYDLRTMQVLFFPPDDSEDREIMTVTITEAISMIENEKRRRSPRWQQYYLKHRDEELARRRAYRTAHKEQVREYNQQYYQARKRQKAAVEGRGVSTLEGLACST